MVLLWLRLLETYMGLCGRLSCRDSPTLATILDWVVIYTVFPTFLWFQCPIQHLSSQENIWKHSHLLWPIFKTARYSLLQLDFGNKLRGVVLTQLDMGILSAHWRYLEISVVNMEFMLNKTMGFSMHRKALLHPKICSNEEYV